MSVARRWLALPVSGGSAADASSPQETMFPPRAPFFVVCGGTSRVPPAPPTPRGPGSP